MAQRKQFNLEFQSRLTGLMKDAGVETALSLCLRLQLHGGDVLIQGGFNLHQMLPQQLSF